MSDEREELDALAERVPSAEVLAKVAMSPREWALAEQRDAARERYTKLRQAVEDATMACSLSNEPVMILVFQRFGTILREHPPLERD